MSRTSLPFSLLSIAIAVLLVATTASIAKEPTQKIARKELTPEEKKRNKEVDVAIQKALKFLASKQKKSGAWVIDSTGESSAATSLAVMSFMAAGHVPGEGPYGEAIERGIKWVVDHQQKNDLLVAKKSRGPMYSHGISSLMLAEAIGMMKKEDSKKVRKTLERAIRVILESQNMPKSDRHKGGWRYNITSRDSDLSATGWQLLALRAAKDVGCDVPADAIDRAVKYVKKCSVSKNRGFGYQPGSGSSPTRAGTGILCLEICGKHHSKEAMGAADYLISRPLRSSESYFFYGVYYTGVGMFKIGGKHWDATKKHLTKLLLTSQKKDGSWFAKREDERRNGRVYCTSLAILSLSVEYRYLPIYQR